MSSATAAASPRPIATPVSVMPVVAMYGVLHAFTDAATVTTLYRAGTLSRQRGTIELVILYNLLAFALQALIGPLVDRLRAPRAAALVGSCLALAALMSLNHAPALGIVIVAGIGNALFHLGGGAIALTAAPNRAAPSGVFVGPGAIGLSTGIYLGHQPTISTTPLLIALVLGVVAQALVRAPNASSVTAESSKDEASNVSPVPRLTALVVVGLLLFTVFVRSIIGGGANHALTRTVSLGFALGIAACLGKFVGGFIADRVGWLRTSVGALAISLPLLVGGERHAWAVVLGMVIFQATMPVTLSASAMLMPSRPATAFGLTALAIVIGAAISWAGPSIAQALHRESVAGGLLVVSALGVFYGLSLLGERIPHPARVRKQASHEPA